MSLTIESSAHVARLSSARGPQLSVSRGSAIDRKQTSPHPLLMAFAATSPLIAGPCSVESEPQLRAVAAHLQQRNVGVLRGGAFKPRTSPYDFQGLGIEGLRILSRVAREFGMISISEVLDPRDVDRVATHVDVLQIGSRNMHNFPLLREIGQAGHPTLLKRGFAATVEELLLAAEYIVSAGNPQVALCERGIRTFEPQTRNTLDVSAIALVKLQSWLPVIADVSHAAGRRDLLAPLARAAFAVGADGVMIEVHPDPAHALSDAKQQLNLEQFDDFLAAIAPLGQSTSLKTKENR